MITNLLAPTEGDGRRELSSVQGVACSLISSEAPSADAIVIWGNGPRVRVYCLFGEDAITGEDKAESALASCPTDGEWSLSLPCPEEDLVWVRDELAALSKRVTARKLGDSVPDEELASAASAEGLVDKGAFFRS
ncbi:MAG: hypothetical protein U0Q18_16840 [Bryobacteraceae bacterium]